MCARMSHVLTRMPHVLTVLIVLLLMSRPWLLKVW